MPSILSAAKLQVGNISTPPGTIYYGDMQVVEQSPAPGARVPEGTKVDVRLERPAQSAGLSAVDLINDHQDRRSVQMWVYDGAQWSDQGSLGYGETKTVSLASGRVSTIVAVDRGLVGCNDGAPQNVSRQRSSFGALGDSSGGSTTVHVL